MVAEASTLFQIRYGSHLRSEAAVSMEEEADIQEEAVRKTEEATEVDAKRVQGTHSRSKVMVQVDELAKMKKRLGKIMADAIEAQTWHQRRVFVKPG